MPRTSDSINVYYVNLTSTYMCALRIGHNVEGKRENGRTGKLQPKNLRLLSTICDDGHVISASKQVYGNATIHSIEASCCARAVQDSISTERHLNVSVQYVSNIPGIEIQYLEVRDI